MDINEMKTEAGCYRGDELHMILLVTADRKVLKEWENIPATAQLRNGWERKLLEGNSVIGQISSNGWFTSRIGLINPVGKGLRIWAEPSAVQLEKAPHRSTCPECLQKCLRLLKGESK